MDVEIIVVGDTRALALEAAQRFTQLAREAIASRGRFSAALSGGSTPGALYAALARSPYREQIPWEEVHLFWGDERCVPADDPSSNYQIAHESLIAHVPIPAENIHRIRGEMAPEAAAQAYDRALQDFFCGPYSRFDLVLLGLGKDGHTASLFPGSPGFDGRQRLAQPVTADYEGRPAHRVTLSLAAINTARQVLFLVSGRAKAEIVKAVLEGSGEDYPAQWVQLAAGAVVWMLDEDAASLLGDEVLRPKRWR